MKEIGLTVGTAQALTVTDSHSEYEASLKELIELDMTKEELENQTKEGNRTMEKEKHRVKS